MAKTALSIAIDARPFVGGYAGYTTYLVSVIEPLLSRGFEITLLSNRPLNPAHTIAKQCQVVVFGSARPSVWEQVSVPAYLKAHHFDLYLVGTNRGLPWRKARGTRYILALLDIIPYKFPLYYLVKLHFIIRELRPVAQLMSVVRADEIITISEQSARDIQGFFHRRATALLMRLHKTEVAKVAEPKPQFVYVGGVDKRKKVDVLLRAFAIFRQNHPDFRLLMIGRGYEAFDGLMAELDIKEAVEMTGFVDEATKMRTIAESTALVYPSQYEGYGLAIAEGFMAGVSVVAGAGGSQAEIGGEGVLYIDPTDPADVAEGMEKTLDPAVRQQLEAGREKQMLKLFGQSVDKAIGDYFVKQVERARKRR